MNPDMERQHPGTTRRIAVLVFLFGVIGPALLALGRLFQIGLNNSHLFGVAPTNIIKLQTDPTLWASVVLLGLAIGILVGIAMYERRRGLRRAAPIGFAIVAGVLFVLDLYVVVFE